MREATGHLMELKEDGGGKRWHLQGRRLQSGDVVEIELADGRWVPVRLDGMSGEIRGCGRIELAESEDLLTTLPMTASFRWPE